MKRTARLLLIAIVAMLSLSSCASMLPARFDSLATNVERNGENYTLRKWEKKNAKFKGLCQEYKENFPKYTRSERRRIHSSMATYVKSAAKTGATTVADTVTEITSQITDMVEEAKAMFESLGLGRKKDRD